MAGQSIKRSNYDTHNGDHGEFPENGALLASYCVSEAFSGNLADGTLLLGEKTRAAHSLTDAQCGLLALTRHYSMKDRAEVLNIFERASEISSRFAFLATILHQSQGDIPVFCSGETVVSSDGRQGSIKGVFIFQLPAKE